MALPVIRYPVDLTGTSTENLVADEAHALPSRLVRMVVPHHGDFFSDSTVMVDASTNATLVRGVDYYCAEKSKAKSLETGKEVCSAFIITNQQVSNNVKVTYQCYGGIGSISSKAIIDTIKSGALDGTTVDWETNVVGKPERYIPAAHKTEAYTLYGMEYILDALRGLRQAIVVGDDAIHKLYYEIVDKLREDSKVSATTIKQQMDVHFSNFLNPHRVTAAQVDTYLTQEADTLLNAVKAVNDSHRADKNNPHVVTADQVDTYTKSKVGSDLTALSNTITTGINTHSANKNNPHEETAAMLGIYTTVEHAAIVNPIQDATTAHIDFAGDPHEVTLEQLGMMSKSAVDQVLIPAGDTISSHVADLNNPHGETTASLGLYNKSEINSLTSNIPELSKVSNYNVVQELLDGLSFRLPGTYWGMVRYKAYIADDGRYLLDISYDNKLTRQNILVKRLNLKDGHVVVGGWKQVNGDIIGYDRDSNEVVVPVTVRTTSFDTTRFTLYDTTVTTSYTTSWSTRRYNNQGDYLGTRTTSRATSRATIASTNYITTYPTYWNTDASAPGATAASRITGQATNGITQANTSWNSQWTTSWNTEENGVSHTTSRTTSQETSQPTAVTTNWTSSWMTNLQ